MRFLVALSLLTFSAHTFAARTGVDERIYMCASGSSSKYLKKNKKFRVHVVAGKYIKITRLSDKKWFKASPNGSGYYIFSADASDGNFWPKTGQGGYLGDVDKNGSLGISVQIGRGQYEGDELTCKLVRTVSELDPLTETEKTLTEIGENANVANGSFDIAKYEPGDFDLDTQKSKLNHLRRRGCKWQLVEDEEAVLSAVRKGATDPDAATKIEKLKKKPGVAGLLALVSDNDISCSDTFVWLFTKDGYKLELLYEQGD